MQVIHLPMRSERGPVSSEWFSTNYGVMLFICVLLSKESHVALPINPYPGYIFDPMPLVEGIETQEGSLCMMF